MNKNKILAKPKSKKLGKLCRFILILSYQLLISMRFLLRAKTTK